MRKSITENEIQLHLVSKTTCRFHNCFEINDCSVTTGNRIGIFVYPDADYFREETGDRIDLFMSVEYQHLLEAVRRSQYYTDDASRACVFVPAVDTLSQDAANIEDMSLVLQSLPQ